MAVNLRGRSLVSLSDLSREALLQILETARLLKLERFRGQPHPLLAGKTLGMIFQKPSMRTRVSFEAGMTQLGGHAIYLAPSDIGLGTRESAEDVGIVMSRYCDIVMARVFGHDIVEGLAKHATVPVINGLSDREHPCQALADLLTIHEKVGRFAGVRAVYVGDGNNVAHSLMYGAALAGIDMVVATPPGFEPNRAITESAKRLAAGASAIEVTNDVKAACRGAHVIYTDVWASMGQEKEAESRREKFRGYQVNGALVKIAAPGVVILHCLPAHYGEEIDYATSRLPTSAIFDQAENRLHAQKALMVLLAG
jgi:ornithine carbamoyltransferase